MTNTDQGIKSLGSIIKKFRKAHGWTQEELAEASGLQRGHISRLERDDFKRPTAETFLKLARAFKIHPRELFYAAGYDINGIYSSIQSLDFLEPAIRIFFQEDWPELTDDECALVRRILWIIKETKDERIKKLKQGGA